MNWEEIAKEFALIDMRSAELAQRKNHDYGNAWEAFRLSTLIDIMMAKARRVDNLHTLGEKHALVPDKITDELLDIINYCRFTLIKIEKGIEPL